MVKTYDLPKVLKALETVLNDCLSVNRDDTLIEKLFTFLRHDLNLNLVDKQLVLKCIEKSIDLSINELKANNDCNDWTLVAIKLRICGSILSDKELFVCQQKCLEFIELMSNEVINCNKSSLRYSYFSCLNDITDHRFGKNWILSKTFSNSTNFKTFPQLLWYFLNKTETRFVETQVLKLFVCLSNHSLIESDLAQNFDEIFVKMISSLNPLNIDIIREILVSIESKRELIEKFKLIDVLLDCIELWSKIFGEKLFVLSQTLGLCVENYEKAIEITDKLISTNDLLSVIGFLTEFIKSNNNYVKHISEKWFNYTFGWFAINSQQIDCFDLTISDKIFLEKFSNKTTNDYCLKQINKLDFNNFDDKQIRLMFEVILKYIQLNKEKRELRKTILQSFNILEKISLNSMLKNETIQYFLELYSDLLAFVSNDYKIIILKSLRLLMANNVFHKTCDSENNGIIKVCKQLNSFLIEFEINENNWEITDSILEVIYSLFSSLSKSGLKLISISSQLLTTVLSIDWTENENNLCPTIRSTLVSVLIVIALNTSDMDLSSLCVPNNNIKDLKSLSILLLSDELIVKTIIIKTFEENICSLIDIEEQNKQLLEEIIKILCDLSINELDEDLQTNGLKLLNNLFNELKGRKQFSVTFNLFFDCHYLHVIYHLINSSEYLFKVKQICVHFIEYFQNEYNLLYGKESEPKLQSLITSGLSVNFNSDTKFKQFLSIDSQKVLDFILNFDTKKFNENEIEDRLQHNVLDDILSVSLIDTNILIDCY